MPPRGQSKADRKQGFHAKITKLLESYDKMLIVNIDNIGSDHMQRIRKGLRGLGELVCGKNTLLRRSVRLLAKKNAALDVLMPAIYGNVAFVFTKSSLGLIRDKLNELKVEAPAKPGAVAPSTVTILKGPTGLEPTKTSFLQALNIASKINRGQIEITNDKIIINAGEKVGQSEATLLQMLGIKPFSYAVTVANVYDRGTVYEPKILDISEDHILAQFNVGVKRIASISLSTGYPTVASLPHSIINGYKRILAIALGTAYTFPKAELIKQMAENPGAFVAQAAPNTNTSAAAKKPVEEEKKEKTKEPEPEPEPEEEEELGAGDMFGGGDDDW